MKKILIIISMVICFTFPVNASDNFYKLTKANYPVIVNEEYLVSDKPVLNYNGTTYLPLRDISKATNTELNWDDINKKIIIKSIKEGVKPTISATTPTPMPPNYDKIQCYASIMNAYKEFIDVNNMLNAFSNYSNAQMQRAIMNMYQNDDYKKLCDFFDSKANYFNALLKKIDILQNSLNNNNVDELSYLNAIISDYKIALDKYSLSIVNLGNYILNKKQSDFDNYSSSIKQANDQIDQLLKQCNDRYSYYLGLILLYK